MKLVTTCPRCAIELGIAEVQGLLFLCCEFDSIAWPVSTEAARQLEQRGVHRVKTAELEGFELVDPVEERTPRRARRFPGAGRPRGGGERVRR